MKRSGRTLVLVAVDDSEYAKSVASEAARIAALMKADVVLLSVVVVPSLAASEGEIDAEYLNEEEKEFEALHRRLVESHFPSNKGALIESKVLHGEPADKIVRYALQTKADLIVMGNRGKGRLARALLGSVSERVVRDSECSVLIVKKSR